MSPRSLVVSPLLAAAAIALAGCFPTVERITAEQELGSDEVTVEVGICQGQFALPPTPPGCGSDNLAIPADSQLLLGIEVDDDSEFVDGEMTGGIAGALDEHAGLLSRLNADMPPSAGRRWVALASGSLAAPSGSRTTARTTLTRALEAPQLFPYEVVVASRFLGGIPASSDVPALTGIISQLPGVVNSGTVALRDVSLAGPAAPLEAQPGSTAVVPFTVNYRGTGASGAVPVAAASGLPGTTATPDVTSLSFPSTTNRTVNVRVPVPAEAAAGDYAVTVQLPLAPGLMRAAFATVRVVRPGLPQPPNGIPQPQQQTPPQTTQTSQTLSVRALRALLNRARLSSLRKAALLRNGLLLRQDFPGPGTAVWELRTSSGGASASQNRRRGQLLARRKARVAAAGRRSVRLRASRRGKRIIRRAKRGRRLVLTTTFTDQQGRKVTASRTVRLR